MESSVLNSNKLIFWGKVIGEKLATLLLVFCRNKNSTKSSNGKHTKNLFDSVELIQDIVFIKCY